ncbi:hypothetical protein FIBSPDRAFT_179396 [Athelia psychrophila]|uniref:Uncharacterized protein n=1 Tax=Athelia psychrophila TaxID=1759441 RepID=A0A166SSQ7_9AGAM|nr:hypothetical protein FIBSPDRAFT_179396 [Fibularhizoctonia sp. CBS 109695]
MTLASKSISTTWPRTFKAEHFCHSESLPTINSVPPEVFIEILSYLKPNSDHGRRYYQNDCSRAEIIPPTHVCQLWRQIALSTPSLSTHINIKLNSRDGTKEVECLTSWLVRGKKCPLFIDLRCYGHCAALEQSAWDALLVLAIQHSYRWREASFESPLPTNLSAVRNNVPLLQTLRFPRCDIAPPNDFETAPMLRSVTSTFHHNYGQPISFGQLPWTQLTNVIANDCSTLSVLAMRQMMPNIIDFLAYCSGRPQQPEFSIPRCLCLSKLQSLDLSGEIDVDDLLDCLELPSLASFSFWEHFDTPTIWSTSLLSLIHRSSCYNVDTLNLSPERCCESEEPSLDELIRATPKLKTLDLINETGDTRHWDCSKIIQALTASPICGTNPYPAPELEKLHLGYAKDFQVQAFVEMVESRWRVEGGGPVKRIHSIYLRYVPDTSIFDYMTMGRLRKFAAEGLHIRVDCVEWLDGREIEHRLL